MRSGKKFTLGFLPALLTIIAMVVAGCGSGGNGPSASTKPAAAPKSQQIFRWGVVDTDIASFDPGIATDLYSINAIQMVFTGLVQENNQLQVQDQLAQSHDMSPDGLTYTFHLRPNLKFSDGTPLTAQDVAYSIDRALSPAVSQLNGVTQTYLGLIKDSDKRLNGKISTLIGDSIKVIDANTISLTISKAAPYFLQALTYPTAYVVEKSVIDKWGTKWTDHLSDNGGQGGDGPFKVKSYSHTTGIVFVPNPNYYGPQPQLQEVDMDFYKTPETSYAAYNANQIDLTPIPAEDYQQAALKVKEYHKFGELTIDYLNMNYLDKPFDNIHIRQAFELAINKDAISKAIYSGIRAPTCHIVPSGMPGYDPNLKCPGGAPTKGDPTMAKQLLQQGMQEEGWTSVSQIPPIKITYESGVSALDNEITTIRQEWQQVLGITVTTQVVDFNTLLNNLALSGPCTQTDLTKCVGKGMQMWALAWGADYPDPQDWLTLQFDKGAPNNNGNYGQNLGSGAAEQQQVQTLMEQADVDQNPTDRIAKYNQAEQALVNDVAWLSLDQRTGVSLMKSYVTGWVDNALNEPTPDSWANVYIAVH